MPPVSSRTTKRSVRSITSSRSGLESYSAGSGRTGRRFANSPRPCRRPSNPCSGRGWCGSVVSHFGPPTAASRTASARRQAARRRGRGADLAFLGLIVLGAVLLLVQMRGLSFFQDDWDFILRRRGFSAHVLLTPHNSHLMLVPILVYKALLAVFGAGSYAP